MRTPTCSRVDFQGPGSAAGLAPLTLALLALLGPAGLMGCAGGTAERPASAGAGASEADTMAQQQAIQPDRIDEIRRICQRKATSVVPTCWSREYERTHNRKLTAQVTLLIIVAPGGSAQEVRVVGNTGGSKELEQCLVAEARDWTYPEGKGPAPVECSFFLQSSM